MNDFNRYAAQMINTISKKGLVNNEEIFEAMKRVPRHLYAGIDDFEQAYGDFPVQIGDKQTISQPLMVAIMTDRLGSIKGKKILEVGTGSGYQAAVLAELGARVITVERIERLYDKAKEILNKNYPDSVTCIFGDGSMGYPEFSYYDGIIVTAGTDEVPKDLIEQLAEGGKIVIPLGSFYIHYLTIIKKLENGRLHTIKDIGCRFVPLIKDARQR